MDTVSVDAPVKKQRLNFIDMARSVAILLMLEGHFVDDSLMNIYRDYSNPVFSTWTFIRGFTAPIFLTVTGLVFVYLLLNNRTEPYFKNIRVKKGFKRAIELIFWGFLLQYYAFHVLQCIGVGILVILILFGLYRLVRVVPLWIYFLVMAMLLFGFNLFLIQLAPEEVWPKNAPYVIQNMFHGPSNRAIFPIVPWMGYTMLGAMMGCLLHDLKDYVKRWIAPIVVLTLGMTLFFFSKEILSGIDYIIGHPFKENLAKLDWLFMRFGMVINVISLLMIIEKLIGDVKPNLFLKIGQNTLTIYIVHMIVLYGSISHFGLNKFFRKALGPWEVTLGAIAFVASFVIFIYYLDWIKAKLEFILGPIRRFFNRIYGIR